MYAFSAKSEANLTVLDQRMVRVVRRAMSFQVMDFTVLETLRYKERQEELFKAGKSTTMNSKHLDHDHDGDGEAVDLLPYPHNVNGVDVWSDKQRFSMLAGLMFAAASIEGVKIRWGGDWDADGNNADSNFHDMPHFELVE